MEEPNIEMIDLGIDIKNTKKYIMYNKSHLTNPEAFKRCQMALDKLEYTILKENQVNGYEFNDGTYVEIIQNKTCRTIIVCNSNYRKVGGKNGK